MNLKLSISPFFNKFHSVIFYQNSLILANYEQILKDHTLKFKLGTKFKKMFFENRLSDHDETFVKASQFYFNSPGR